MYVCLSVCVAVQDSGTSLCGAELVPYMLEKSHTRACLRPPAHVKFKRNNDGDDMCRMVTILSFAEDWASTTHEVCANGLGWLLCQDVQCTHRWCQRCSYQDYETKACIMQVDGKGALVHCQEDLQGTLQPKTPYDCFWYCIVEGLSARLDRKQGDMFVRHVREGAAMHIAMSAESYRHCGPYSVCGA